MAFYVFANSIHALVRTPILPALQERWMTILNGTHFSGPALWNSDSMVYYSEWRKRIAYRYAASESVFHGWHCFRFRKCFLGFDDFNHCIMRYDFVNPHEPVVRSYGWKRSQYTDFSVSRINDDIPDHLVLDHETGIFVYRRRRISKLSGWIHAVEV